MPKTHKTPKVTEMSANQTLVEHIVRELAVTRSRIYEYHKKPNFMSKDELSRRYGEESVLENLVWQIGRRDTAINSKIEVGMLVAPIYKREMSGWLHCGTEQYAFAVVASLKPFTLISENGDMLWSNHKQEDFAPVGYMTKSMWNTVNKRIQISPENNLSPIPYAPELKE